MGVGEEGDVHGVMEWEVPEQRCPSMCQAEHEERMKNLQTHGCGWRASGSILGHI